MALEAGWSSRFLGSWCFRLTLLAFLFDTDKTSPWARTAWVERSPVQGRGAPEVRGGPNHLWRPGFCPLEVNLFCDSRRRRLGVDDSACPWKVISTCIQGGKKRKGANAHQWEASKPERSQIQDLRKVATQEENIHVETINEGPEWHPVPRFKLHLSGGDLRGRHTVPVTCCQPSSRSLHLSGPPFSRLKDKEVGLQERFSKNVPWEPRGPQGLRRRGDAREATQLVGADFFSAERRFYWKKYTWKSVFPARSRVLSSSPWLFCSWARLTSTADSRLGLNMMFWRPLPQGAGKQMATVAFFQAVFLPGPFEGCTWRPFVILPVRWAKVADFWKTASPQCGFEWAFQPKVLSAWELLLPWD